MRKRILLSGSWLTAALLLCAANGAQAQAKLQMTPGSIAVYAGGFSGCPAQTDSLGDGCPATTSANLQTSISLALNPSGNLFIVDYNSNRVRVVDGNFHIQTFAGGGSGCPAQTDAVGDGCPASQAILNGPSAITFDAGGNAYIAEYGYVGNITPRIRMVSAATGIMTTFAGTGVDGYSGDGGPATSAMMEEPTGVAVDAIGNVYIADLAASVVRRVDTNHKITTIAGGGSGCPAQTDSVGDGCPATSASLYDPDGVAVDSTGNVYIADTNNNRVRRVDAVTGIITTAAGTGVHGFSGDNGPATAANLSYPEQLVVDAKGNVYVSDSFNNRIRKINTTGTIATVAGGGAGCTFTPCSALEDMGNNGSGYPVGVAMDSSGNFYLGAGDEVEKVGPDGAMAFPTVSTTQSSAPQTIVLTNLGISTDTLPATAAGYVLTGNNTEFALTGGTCITNNVLAPGAFCTLQAVFTPSSAGERSATVTFSDSALGSPHTMTLYGLGAVAVSQTITFPTIGNHTYGDYLGNLTATASSGLPVTYSIVSGPAIISGSYLTTTGTGTVVVQADQAGNASYFAAPPVQQTFTVAKAVLTVTANQIQRYTNQLNPPLLTYKMTGFVANDTQISATTGQPTLVSAAPANPPAGAYVISISAGNLASANYTFTFVNAFLDISSPSTTQTTLALSTATTSNLQTVKLTATVTTIEPLVPGNVTFTDANGHVLGHAAIVGQYAAYGYSTSTATLSRKFAPGQYQITATYDGTPGYTTSASAPQGLTVTGTQPTFTTLAAQANATSPANSDLTASVLGLGAQPPSGTVSFTDTTASTSLGSVAPTGAAAGFNLQLSSSGPITGFSIQQSPSGNATGPVAVADLDNDGNPDLVAVDHGDVDIFWGNGDGTYTSPTVYSVGTNLQSVAIADFNADGALDIVVADSATGSVILLYGDSLYNDFSSQNVFQIPAPSKPVALVAADFNGDGIPDLAIAQNNGQSLVTILLSDGSGGFLYPQSYGTGGSQGITVGDFNGDGNLDIAASTGANVSVLLGKGDGTFQPQLNSPASGVGGIISGDFNGDGKLDVALANNASVVVALGKGDGTFNPATSYPASVPATSIAAADFNQDGHLDLVTSSATSASSATSVLIGAGDGTFQTPQTYTAGGGPGGIAVADVNGDGTADLVALNAPGGTVSTLLGGIVSTATLANVDIPGTGLHTISSSYAPAASSTYLGSVSNTVTISAQPMIVSSLSPQVIAAGINGLTLTLNGSSFAANSVVLANGAALSTSYVGPTHLTAVVPAAALVQPTAISIQVQAGSVSSNTTTLTVVPDVVLTSLTPTLAVAQSAATPITATGSNFTSTTVLQFNGAAVQTTFVSTTQLQAVLSTANLATAQTAQITAYDPASLSQSASVAFTVLPSPAVVFSGPPTSAAGTQPSLNFQISQPYPIALSGTMTLTFQPSQGEPDDPSIQFASGGRTFNFTLPANSSTTPTVQLQAGTVAGTISVTLTLKANGITVTPPSIVPVAITVPKAIPVITTQSIVRSANSITVYVTGYSSSRDMANAYFNFTPAAGAKFTQSSFTVPVSALFTGWFSSAQSNQYGSTFTYFQTFTLDSKATDVESVSVTLENAQGKSQPEVVQ